MANSNFGTTTINTTYDPTFLTGWGKRPADWEIQTGVQHELASGVSLSATYVRHWWGNALATDNLAVAPSDYSSYCVTAPVDSRLPGGGGNQICGFTDINPDKFGQVNNYVTVASNYGRQTDVYTGFDLAINARLPRGIFVQGGTSTGHEVYDACDVMGKVDNLVGGPLDIQTSGLNTPQFTTINGVSSPSTLYCRVAPPMQTQLKLTAAYPLPWNVSVSAAFQSVPGRQIVASYAVPSSQIAASLGRNLSAGANSTATVQLVAPGTMYGDRLNQFDVRLAKRMQVSGLRIQPQFNVYNLFNAGPVLGYNTTYGPNWQNPTAVLLGRMFKFGAQVDW
jgi:hypothetical protein